MKRLIWGMALSVSMLGIANAALHSRLSGAAYYDDVLDVTWLADANAGAGSIYDDFPYYENGVIAQDWATDGVMTWVSAQAWIGSLNSANYLGVNNWRLPAINPLDGISFRLPQPSDAYYDGSWDHGLNISAPGSTYAGSTASEMAHLSYNTLGNNSVFDLNGIPTVCGESFAPPFCLTNRGPFSNLQPDRYWSGTAWESQSDTAWHFSFDDGSQGGLDTGGHAWALRPGDIAAVPAPGTLWLFGTGLIALGAKLRFRLLPL
jgi:hypothetical protein